MNARDEWSQILQDNREIYIYGAGKFGKILLKRFQKDGKAEKVKGFLVTDTKDNPFEIEHKIVTAIKDFHDRDALILVAVPHLFQKDIFSTLSAFCFKNVINAEKFLFMETEDVEVVTVSELLQKQYIADSFEGYGIIVRLLAIESCYGINDFGAELLEKIDNKMGPINKRMVENGEKEEILTDEHYKILAEGEMAFASALFKDKMFVRIRTAFGKVSHYDISWLKCHFDESEIKLIIERYHNLLKSIQREKEGYKALIEKISAIYGSEQEFCKDKFYQSLEELGISGVRPTEKRIEIYGLPNIIKDKSVLDIGCNCGFLDIRIGQLAKSVKGVEYNKSLVKIANVVRDYLGRSNVNFEYGDFREYVPNEKYEIIFSFAVHHWIGLEPIVYCRKVVSMLEDKGHVFFESHGTKEEDKDYEKYCQEFERNGLLKIREDEIFDDGKCRRNFVIYQKQ